MLGSERSEIQMKDECLEDSQHCMQARVVWFGSEGKLTSEKETCVGKGVGE